jgi:hypothetical protein
MRAFEWVTDQQLPITKTESEGEGTRGGKSDHVGSSNVISGLLPRATLVVSLQIRR